MTPKTSRLTRLEQRKKDAEDIRYFANALRNFLRLDPLYQDGNGRQAVVRRMRERFGRPTNIKKERIIHHE